MSRLQALWAWWTDEHVVFATPDVLRVMMRCTECQRIRPAWNLVGKTTEMKRGGACRCGNVRQRPANVGFWEGFAWVIVRGLVWRKWVRRQATWDPRLPLRDAKPGEF